MIPTPTRGHQAILCHLPTLSDLKGLCFYLAPERKQATCLMPTYLVGTPVQSCGRMLASHRPTWVPTVTTQAPERCTLYFCPQLRGVSSGNNHIPEALHSPQGTPYSHFPLHPSLHAIPASHSGAGAPCPNSCLCQEPFPIWGASEGFLLVLSACDPSLFSLPQGSFVVL